jgi:hypothetical protein
MRRSKNQVGVAMDADVLRQVADVSAEGFGRPMLSEEAAMALTDHANLPIADVCCNCLASA